MRVGRRNVLATIGLLACLVPDITGQSAPVIGTLAMVERYPTFFHGRTVSVVATPTIVEGLWRLPLSGGKILVFLPRAGTPPLRQVEVRGQLFDTGRFDAEDSRLSASGIRTVVEKLSPASWPARNQFFVLTDATWRDEETSAASIRSIVLHPRTFEGSRVTLRGRFRAQNLYGDLPAWPRKSNWDFVLQVGDGSIWVTGLRPRGKDFDLDPGARRGAGTWLEVTGIFRLVDDLPTLEAKTITRTTAGEEPPARARQRHARSAGTANRRVQRSARWRTRRRSGRAHPNPVLSQHETGVVSGGRANSVRRGCHGPGPDVHDRIPGPPARRRDQVQHPRSPAIPTSSSQLADGIVTVDDAPAGACHDHVQNEARSGPAVWHLPHHRGNRAAIDARTRSTSASRSSWTKPAVSTGAPRSTRTVTGQMSGLPFRMAFRPPLTATGTIGACALMAMTKPPFLNGSSSPVRLRVPSGKITERVAGHQGLGRAVDGRPALLRIAALRAARTRRRRTPRRAPATCEVRPCRAHAVWERAPRGPGRRQAARRCCCGCRRRRRAGCRCSRPVTSSRMPTSAKPTRTPAAPARYMSRGFCVTAVQSRTGGPQTMM